MEDLYINLGTELGSDAYIGTRDEWLSHLMQNTEWYGEYVSFIEDGNEERRLEAEELGESIDNIVFAPIDVPSIEEWADDMFTEYCVEWDGIEDGERL